LFDGFYKCEYGVGDVFSRSVMYCADGKMLGGNSAFAHTGTYQETADGEVSAVITGKRHNFDPGIRTLYGSDTSRLSMRGRGENNVWRFEGGSPEGPGLVFRAVMTRLDEDEFLTSGLVGDGGISNGLYSIEMRTLDGVDGGLKGVLLLHQGRILGGDAFFYYLGSYSSADARWKGEMLNQEHTPAGSTNRIFGGTEVGIGFSGTWDGTKAELEAAALAGKRSLRLRAELELMYRVG
jgi:hypothetical protein